MRALKLQRRHLERFASAVFVLEAGLLASAIVLGGLLYEGYPIPRMLVTVVEMAAVVGICTIIAGSFGMLAYTVSTEVRRARKRRA